MANVDIEWDKVKDSEGVIVGCTKDQEWLLPWWYINFRLHNPYPITFVNFGDMSERAIEWCRERGRFATITADGSYVAKKEAIDPKLAEQWEKRRADVWKLRSAWFKKPLALLKSCYEKTVWLDLDCQCVRSINPLFTDHLKQGEIALVPESHKDQVTYRERGELLPGEIMYNSGVIAYRHGSEIIRQFAKCSVAQNNLFIGDQQLLSRLLHENTAIKTALPSIYNWAVASGKNPQAVILHYWGAYQMQIQLAISILKNNFQIDLSTLSTDGSLE